MPSNYSDKRKAGLVPHFYDRSSKRFGFIDPRATPHTLARQAIDQAYLRRAESQSWRENVLVRKVVRHG